jgi:hypothetical protein
MSNISWVPYFKPLQFVIPSYSSINGIKGLGGKYKKGWHGDKILVHFKNLEPSVTTNSRGLILNQKIHRKLKYITWFIQLETLVKKFPFG